MAVIGKIRERIWLLIPLIAVALVGFLFMTDFSSFGGGAGGASQINVGSVNGEPISYTEYERRVQQSINNYQTSVNASMSDEDRLRIREQAWDQYVQEIVSKEEYDKLGLTVPKSEMLSLLTSENAHPSVKNTAAFKDPETGAFSAAKVKEYLVSLNSPDVPEAQAAQMKAQWVNFEGFIKDNQLSNKYNTLVQKAVYVPQWYAQATHEADNKQANIEYVHIPYTDIADEEVAVSDGEISTYLRNNSTRFQQEANRSMDYVMFPIKPSVADSNAAKQFVAEKVNDFRSSKDDAEFIKLFSETPFNGAFTTTAQLVSNQKNQILSTPVGSTYGPYYEAGSYKVAKVLAKQAVPDSVNVRHILRNSTSQSLEAAKATIDSIKNVIRNGDGDFAELAKTLSEDTGSGAKGGELGWNTAGKFVPEFNNAVFYEGNTGDLMTVKTQFGWHLIEIVEKSATSDAVKVAYLTRKVEASSNTRDDIFAEASRFASQNRTDANFRDAAQQAGYTIKSATGITQNAYKIPGIDGTVDRVVNWLNKNNTGTVSNAFELDNNFLVSIVTAVNSAGMRSVEDARGEIESELKKEKKAAKVAEQLAGSTDLNAIAGQFSKEVKTAQNINFSSANITGLGAEPKVGAAIFGLNANDVSKPIAGNRGVTVVKVVSFTDAPALTDTKAIKDKIANPIRNRVSTGLGSALKKASNVKDKRYELRQ